MSQRNKEIENIKEILKDMVDPDVLISVIW